MLWAYLFREVIIIAHRVHRWVTLLITYFIRSLNSNFHSYNSCPIGKRVVSSNLTSLCPLFQVGGVFTNNTLLSSTGGQPRTMTIACFIWGTLGPIIQTQEGLNLMPCIELFFWQPIDQEKTQCQCKISPLRLIWLFQPSLLLVILATFHLLSSSPNPFTLKSFPNHLFSIFRPYLSLKATKPSWPSNGLF